MHTTHIVMNTWLYEFVHHPEIYPLFIAIGIWIVYLLLFIFRQKLFKGRLSFMQMIFKGWILKYSALGLIVWGVGLYTDYDKRIKKEIENALVSDEIKSYVDNLTSDDLRRIRGNLSAISPGLKENFGKGIKKDFKAIAFIQDTDGVMMEERLNEELKKRDQYTKDAEELDYLVLFFQDWNSDLYTSDRGGFSTCRTEIGFFEIIDYKSNEVVDTFSINRNANPESFTSTSEYGGKSIPLTSEELYDAVFGKKEIVIQVPETEYIP